MVISICLYLKGSQLRFQYVGLKTQIVPVKNGMRVVMKADAGSLDEVIVTGYGNFKKSSFTGAAASIDPGKLADVPVTSVQDKLAGSIPGVTVTSSSGAPGSVGSIRVRGMGSINAGNNRVSPKTQLQVYPLKHIIS